MSRHDKEYIELDMLVAELDYENRLLRTRNQRVEALNEDFVRTAQLALDALEYVRSDLTSYEKKVVSAACEDLRTVLEKATS